MKRKTKQGGKSGEIRVRPAQDAWVLAGLFAGIGVFLGFGLTLTRTAPPFPWFVGWALVAALVLPGSWLAAWLCRTLMWTTPTGLRARNLFRQWETPWADIADFYTVPPALVRDNNEARLRPDAFVVDRNGRTVAAFRASAKNADLLCARIAGRAVNAKTPTWQIKGSRPFDPWPRVFGYNTPDNRLARRVLAVGTAFTSAVGVYLSVVLITESLARHEFGGWTIAQFGMLWIFAGLYVLLFCLSLKVNKTRIRPHERFVVDWDGFTFCTPGKWERVLWKNVIGYGFAPSPPPASFFSHTYALPYRIETVHQGAFDFSDALGDLLLFREIVKLRAENANQTDWPRFRCTDSEPLGDKKLLWSGGCEGVGERVFHYRTREARMGLWAAGVFPFIGAVMAIETQLGLTRTSNATPDWILCAVFTLLLLLAVWRYYAAHIRIGEAGITQKTPWGETFIAWADVEAVDCKSKDPFAGVVRGASGRTIRWTPDFIASEAELKAVVQSRRPT